MKISRIHDPSKLIPNDRIPAQIEKSHSLLFQVDQVCFLKDVSPLPQPERDFRNGRNGRNNRNTDFDAPEKKGAKVIIFNEKRMTRPT